MTPLKITLYLRTAVSIPTTIATADGPFAWAAVMQAEDAGHPDPRSEQTNTGIAVHQVADQWCPMAGQLEYNWVSERISTHHIKRQRAEAYSDAWMEGVIHKRPAFNPNGGLTKMGSFAREIRWTDQVTAWLVASDVNRIHSLLPLITHIGAMRSKDRGAVSRYEVAVDEQAHDMWMRRPLPLNSPYAKENHVRGESSLHSPYWLRSNIGPAMLPVTF